MSAAPGQDVQGRRVDAPATDAVRAARHLRLVRLLCVGVIVVAALEFVIATTAMTLRRLPDSTDFATYYLAGAQARESLSPYDAAAVVARGHALGFAHDQFPFLYPPPFAIAMQPLATLSYEQARGVWVILVTLALFVGLTLNTLVMRHQVVALGLRQPLRVWIVLGAFVPAALNSTGVHNDIRAGSVAAFLYAALMLVAWGIVTRRLVPAALGLAAAAILKLTPVVLLAWAAWRRARGAVLVSGVILLAAGLVAAVQLGWGIGVEYVRDALLPALESEAPRPMNQSLDAFLSRLLVPSEIVRAPFHQPALKAVASVALSLVLLVVTVRTLRPRRRHAALLPVELGLVMLALLMLMKLTWLHTLASVLFVWPCVMLPILRAAEREARWALRAGVLACLGFFLSSAHIPVLWNGLRQGPATLFISVHLFGLFISWWVCRFVLKREADIVG